MEQRFADVDVVIPVYNGEGFIREAIESVQQQTVVPNKIIVVDDGSTDDTAGVIAVSRGVVPVQYVLKENGGLSSARNRGLQEVNSEYVAFLDADDVWIRNKLEQQLKVFEETKLPRLGLVYCGYEIIDFASKLIPGYRSVPIDQNMRGDIFDKLLPANKITGSGSGVLVKSSCFSKVGKFDERLSACEDWDMWLRIAAQYQFDYVDEVLVKIRRHGQNMQANKLHMLRNEVLLYNLWVDRLPSNKNVPAHWAKMLFILCVERLPRLDFFRIVRHSLTPKARRRLSSVAFRELKLYVLMRVLLLPLIFGSKLYRRFRMRSFQL
jgi:glycosyltransferase involved in cell wall biosynthesis